MQKAIKFGDIPNKEQNLKKEAAPGAAVPLETVIIVENIVEEVMVLDVIRLCVT